MMKNDFSEPCGDSSVPVTELFDDEDFESEEELAWGEGFRIDDDGHWIPVENRYEYDRFFYYWGPDKFLANHEYNTANYLPVHDPSPEELPVADETQPF